MICGFIPLVGWILSLFCLVPGIAVTVRRLHDTGKSGYYYFMCFIPIVGAILLIIQLIKDSDYNNQYGPGNGPYSNNMYRGY